MFFYQKSIAYCFSCFEEQLSFQINEIIFVSFNDIDKGVHHPNQNYHYLNDCHCLRNYQNRLIMIIISFLLQFLQIIHPIHL